MKISTTYFLSAILLSFGSAEAAECVCFAYGCDQRGCGAGAICPFGGCNQDGLESPICSVGHCSQIETSSPICGGGFCDQTGSTNAVCGGGHCCQDQAEGGVCSFNCICRNSDPDSNYDWQGQSSGYIQQWVPENYQDYSLQYIDSNIESAPDSNNDWEENVDTNWQDHVDTNWQDHVDTNWQDHANNKWQNGDYSYYEWDSNAEKATRFSSPSYEALSNSDNWAEFKETNFDLDMCLCVVGGCDQTSCGSNAVCPGSLCDQAGLVSPSCDGGGCNQNGASDPTCKCESQNSICRASLRSSRVSKNHAFVRPMFSTILWSIS